MCLDLSFVGVEGIDWWMVSRNKIPSECRKAIIHNVEKWDKMRWNEDFVKGKSYTPIHRNGDMVGKEYKTIFSSTFFNPKCCGRVAAGKESTTVVTIEFMQAWPKCMTRSRELWTKFFPFVHSELTDELIRINIRTIDITQITLSRAKYPRSQRANQINFANAKLIQESSLQAEFRGEFWGVNEKVIYWR